MEEQSSIIRSLINDILRSLSAALVHVDDLILKINKNSDEFSDVILTNEQLSRSVELFLDLRSECNCFLDQLFVNKNNSLKENNSTISQVKHNLNGVLDTVLPSCDIMLKYGKKNEL
jgi:hypothetical protein